VSAVAISLFSSPLPRFNTTWGTGTETALRIRIWNYKLKQFIAPMYDASFIEKLTVMIIVENVAF
jgi:hypothetical protein